MARGQAKNFFFNTLVRISRIKHLKWWCLCLFCVWFCLMIFTFITVLYVSYPYTNYQRLSPITLTESPQTRPNNIGVYSNHKKTKHESATHHNFNPNADTNVIHALLRRILQQKHPSDIDVATISDKFKFDIQPISTLCAAVSPTAKSTIYGCYTIDIQPNTIIIAGTDILSIISGLNYYINNYWLLSVSWTGNNIQFVYDEYYQFINDTIHNPVSNIVYGYRQYEHTYYKNPCTDSYSMAFWTFAEWEPHIDWMAMNNINLFLLPSLNELIEYVLWTKHFKLSHDDLMEYFVGPAFFAWFRMGNLKGWPPRYIQEKRVLSLTKHWFDQQLALTQQIMTRCNELGIEIILSSFSGNVPETMLALYPDSDFYVGSIWYGFSSDHTQLMFLDCTDALYVEIGKQYQRIQYNILKSIDFFVRPENDKQTVKNMYLWLDQFNELIPSRFDNKYLESCGTNHFDSLQLYEYTADPYIAITWVVQGWMFVNERRFWINERIYSYLFNVEPDDILILDLIAEKQSIALESMQFFEHNYIWCFLHNFGGNYYLGGNLQNIFFQLKENQKQLAISPYLKGIGITMEGITNNEILYAAVLQHSFVINKYDIDEDGMDLFSFVQRFMASRYGKFISEFHDNKIFDIYSELIQIVYSSYYKKWGVARSLIAMRPSLLFNEYNMTDLVSVTDTDSGTLRLELNGPLSNMDQTWRISQFQSNYIDYNFCKLFENWKKWFLFIRKFKYEKKKYLIFSPGFSNDIAEVTRQVLSDLFFQVYSLWKINFVSNNYEKNEKIQLLQDRMLLIIDDMNDLLSYFEHFRLDKWISAARSYGKDENEANYLEMNARNLITRWGPNAEISEYASREWNGLLNNYYKKRWKLFFDGNKLNEIDDFEIDFQYETIDELELDDNYNQNRNDFTQFYNTLDKIYKKYIKIITCKQNKMEK